MACRYAGDVPVDAKDIVVRDVRMDHIEQIAPMWDRAWRTGGRRRTDVPLALSIDRLRRRVEVAAGGGYRLLAAWRAEEVVGIATVSLTDGGPLMDAPGVHIHMMYVDESWRGRGVGTVILAEVTAWATSLGSEQVVVDVPPASRDVQRWYARWGFGPYLQRRVASTEAIARMLRGQVPLRVVRGGGQRRIPQVSGLRRAASR